MADNYLENQYEQYQARKAAWEREHKYGKKKKKSAERFIQFPMENRTRPGMSIRFIRLKMTRFMQ